MKKVISLIAVLALLVCSCAAFAEGDKLSEIQESGTLVIATEGDWAPWTYHDEETNELTGFDIEVGKLIAEGLGVTAEFQETAWDSILAGVDAGRFDIACNGVGYTEERAEKYAFTEPYVYTHKVLVVRGDNEDIKSLDDLAGKKTANSPSSTYAQIAEDHGATVEYIDTLGETMEMLINGRVDATVNADVSVADYMKEHPDANIKIVQTIDAEPVAFPVQKGENTDTLVAAVNDILDKAREDGTLSELSIKYFGIDLTTAD